MFNVFSKVFLGFTYKDTREKAVYLFYFNLKKLI